MSDNKLKLKLAGMLPEKIEYRIGGDCELPDNTVFFFWKDQPQILETEWLHACHLIEHTLKHPAIRDYARLLTDMCEDLPLGAGSATWQQRAMGLIKVKQQPTEADKAYQTGMEQVAILTRRRHLD